MTTQNIMGGKRVGRERSLSCKSRQRPLSSKSKSDDKEKLELQWDNEDEDKTPTPTERQEEITWKLAPDPRKMHSAKIYGSGGGFKDFNQWRSNGAPLTTGSSDDEFVRKYLSGMSSASSSISWAEDAMESEFTQRLNLLWEDIEKVCTEGHGIKKPEGMNDAIYQECLQWKRAFPVQNLVRFKRSKDGDVTPTPTTSANHQRRFIDNLSPLPLSLSRPTTPSLLSLPPYESEECSTPVPPARSDYINAWLNECQTLSPTHQEQKPILLERKPLKKSFSKDDDGDFSLPPIITNTSHNKLPTLKVLTSAFTRTKPERHQQQQQSSNTKEYFKLPLTNTIVNEPLFTSLGPTLSNTSKAGRNSFEENYENGRESPTWKNIRVQRPISSQIKGHTITPIATGINQRAHSSLRRLNSSTVRTTNNYLPPATSSRVNLSKLIEEDINSTSQKQRINRQIPRTNNRVTFNNTTTFVGSNNGNSTWSRYNNSVADITEEDSLDERGSKTRPNFLRIPTRPLSKIENRREKGQQQPMQPFLHWLIDRIDGSPN